jgi:hypothetical protein
MRQLSFGTPTGTSVEAKLDWCIRALQELERGTHEVDAARTADGFTISNVTESRTLDADCGVLANLAAAQAAIDATRDVLCTLLQDLKRRGQKRTSS